MRTLTLFCAAVLVGCNPTDATILDEEPIEDTGSVVEDEDTGAIEDTGEDDVFDPDELAGPLSVQVNIQMLGQEIDDVCSGELTASVSKTGISGEAVCTMAEAPDGFLLSDLTGTLSGVEIAGEVSGVITLDIEGYPVPISWIGTYSDGELIGTIEGEGAVDLGHFEVVVALSGGFQAE